MPSFNSSDTAAAVALPPVTLVLGGARSGKSAHAERLIERATGPGLYLATAEPGDAEMAARIQRHRDRRGNRWATLEVPLELADALMSEARPERPVLVDCLTLWLGNLIEAGRDPAAERVRLTEALAKVAGPVVLVSNEVGLGVVPDNALARRFRDEAGRLNQEVAEVAHRVLFLAAGLAMVLKDGRTGGGGP
ncbi:MAG: bifunctional adenosylcobinamide kinase/adenosylcobinamide-phosphate guanylyltransferase [Kiloniellales bacterium]